jgi:hypothetical protein
MATLVWLVLLVGVPLVLAYRRADLRTATAVLGALLLAYSLFGSGGALWTGLLWVLFAGLAVLNLETLRRDNISRAFRCLSPNAAEHVENRAGSARGRQRLVGWPAVHRHAGLAQAE